MRFTTLTILLLWATATVARPQSTIPTEAEIEAAYRSKFSEGGSAIPGVGWEKRRINKIREWSLKFKRLARSREFGFLTQRYRITARKDRTCVEYRLTERIPVSPAPSQVKPILAIDPGPVESCR